MAELHPGSFHKHWLAYLKELGTPLDHLAWTAAIPEVVLLDLPEPYLPMILSSFNEEEYVNKPTDGEAGDGGAKVREAGVEGDPGSKA